MKHDSATDADWRREHKRWWQWSPSRSLLASIRSFQRANGPLRLPIKAIAIVRHRFWAVITGADIPIITRIGGGLILPHPSGVVINLKAVIGVNCLINSGVVIGELADDPRAPVLGAHVYVGSGAKLLGGVTLSDHSRVGANAVVLCNVSAYCTAVGAPARVVQPRRR